MRICLLITMLTEGLALFTNFQLWWQHFLSFCLFLSLSQQDNIDRSSNHRQADLIGPAFQQSANRSSPNHQGWSLTTDRSACACACVFSYPAVVWHGWAYLLIFWHRITFDFVVGLVIWYCILLRITVHWLKLAVYSPVSYMREYKKVIDMTWESDVCVSWLSTVWRAARCSLSSTGLGVGRGG